MGNVLINGRTAVHAGSGGVLITTDICLTKVGKPVVPIPYTNVAQSSDADNTASTVFINGEPACHALSTFACSIGDQAGDRGGIRSGTTEGQASFITSSSNVFIEGIPAVRLGDLMISNNGNTPPAPLMQPGASLPPEVEAAAQEWVNNPVDRYLDFYVTHGHISMMVLACTQEPAPPENPDHQENPVAETPIATAAATTNDDENDENWLTVPEGQFTFDVEGDDKPGSPYFSRVAHATIGASGITLGRGYDLYQQYLRHSRNTAKVIEDLNAAAIPPELIERLRPAITLQEEEASDFFRANEGPIRRYLITRKQQYDLFNRIYPAYKRKASTLYANHLRESGSLPAFEALHGRIQALLIDMGYRGDFQQVSYTRDNYFNETKPVLTPDELAEVRTAAGAFRSVVTDNDPTALAQYFRDYKDTWKKQRFWKIPAHRAAARIWFLENGLPIPSTVVQLVFPDGY